jgi:23S rRNA pseudouridine1911/1915/1917 synthase
VVFARGARAREAVQAARAKGTYDRRYVALASKAPSPSAGEWSAPIGRAKDPKKRAAHGRDAAPALTRYHVAATTSLACLLSVEPVTGRTHQIRVHASHAGSPLLGDRDYGGPRRLVLPSGKVLALDRIALHCAEVHVLGLDLRAPVPDELRAWWRALGGNDDAW